jgi:lysozyme
MTIDQAGLDFITGFEGFSASVYNDIAGKPTIGIGHKILPGEDFKGGVTLLQAQALLSEDLEPVEDAIAHMIPHCNQNQFNALCSFGFNLGVGALLQMLMHGWAEVPEQMLRWNHADGVVVAGLARRRQAEVALFTS